MSTAVPSPAAGTAPARPLLGVFEAATLLALLLGLCATLALWAVLQAMRYAPPALVVLDLHLPDGTGFDLLPKLRARAGRKRHDLKTTISGTVIEAPDNTHLYDFTDDGRPRR